MTRKAKIAVTVPEETLEVIRRAVAHERAASVSAYVTQALEEKAQREDFDDLLARMLNETGGPVTDAERARYRDEFGCE